MRVITALLHYKRIFVAVFILLCVCTYYYAVCLPNSIAHTYFMQIASDVDAISSLFNQASKDTQQPLFNNPNLSPAQRQKSLDTVIALNTNIAARLDGFAIKINDLKKAPPGTTLASQYAQAANARTQAQAVLAQSRDVLNDYNHLVLFMHVYYPAQSQVAAMLASVNSMPDFSQLFGKSESLGESAAAIRTLAAALRDSPVPHDFADFKNEALAAFDDAARAFDSLAEGVRTGIETTIDSAAKDMESATVRIETTEENLYTLLSRSSPTVHHITELPDKAQGLCVFVPEAQCEGVESND